MPKSPEEFRCLGAEAKGEESSMKRWPTKSHFRKIKVEIK